MIQLTTDSLAYTEMRFILARMIWNFDFQIAEESRNWAEGLQLWLTYLGEASVASLLEAKEGT